ncbi:MAG TPA: Wadjet anti-phage system protein JetD domain-containing protein [Nocardioidaceae bacterium]|nr:Wadjet anti-phage system protein JetD domain-containing protein [Nocardioidaceae bacterium]
MKTPEEVTADIARRLERSWAKDAVERAGGVSSDVTWPHPFPLGRPKSTELESRFGEVTREVAEWRSWANEHGLGLRTQTRRVAGTEQTLPTHITMPDIDKAASIVGGPWPARLTRSRERAGTLRDRFPALDDPAWVVRSTDDYRDVDFRLLLDAAAWFATTSAADRGRLTPRQVPVVGLHAKWLNTRRSLVTELAGLEDLGLLPAHPARIHFTYLDPTYLASGRRRHDSASVGDSVELPYVPQVVLISENKDTAVGFPEVPGGIAIEGAGRGASTHAAFDWLYNIPVVAYWGDMDADGLEILNEFRAAGLVRVSLLMDMAAYEEWEPFGTNDDPQGRALKPREPRAVEHLAPGEAELYVNLTSPKWTRDRRIEQERIPLSIAHEELLVHLAGASDGPEAGSEVRHVTTTGSEAI